MHYISTTIHFKPCSLKLKITFLAAILEMVGVFNGFDNVHLKFGVHSVQYRDSNMCTYVFTMLMQQECQRSKQQKQR